MRCIRTRAVGEELLAFPNIRATIRAANAASGSDV